MTGRLRRSGPRGGPWRRFVLHRVARLVIVSVVLVSATFMVVRLVPGDPAQAAIGLQPDRTPGGKWYVVGPDGAPVTGAVAAATTRGKGY